MLSVKVLHSRKTVLHYITFYIRTIYSGLSKDNCKDHYGDQTIKQCLGMIAEMNEFSVIGEMLRAMGQTGHHQVDCSRVAGRQWQMSDRRQ